MARIWIICAALLGAAGVSVGAYHAHGLQQHLERLGLSDSDLQHRMANCETAVRYQMYHALTLLLVGLLATRHGHSLLGVAGILFVLGVAAFSGGLYLIVFAGNMIHWAIVPAGGTMLILGWIALAISGFFLRLAPAANDSL